MAVNKGFKAFYHLLVVFSVGADVAFLIGIICILTDHIRELRNRLLFCGMFIIVMVVKVCIIEVQIEF